MLQSHAWFCKGPGSLQASGKKLLMSDSTSSQKNYYEAFPFLGGQTEANDWNESWVCFLRSHKSTVKVFCLPIEISEIYCKAVL